MATDPLPSSPGDSLIANRVFSELKEISISLADFETNNRFFLNGSIVLLARQLDSIKWYF